MLTHYLVCIIYSVYIGNLSNLTSVEWGHCNASTATSYIDLWRKGFQKMSRILAIPFQRIAGRVQLLSIIAPEKFAFIAIFRTHKIFVSLMEPLEGAG